MKARTSSENVSSRFCNHFSIIQTHYAWKMCSNYPGIKLEPVLGTKKKIEHLSSCPHVVHSTAKLVISRRRKNENVDKMSKNEKCMCKACKKAGFHCQICKLVGFLLPSSSWLLKLPNNRVGKYKLKKYQFGNKTKESGTNFRYLVAIANSLLVDFGKRNCPNMG